MALRSFSSHHPRQVAGDHLRQFHAVFTGADLPIPHDKTNGPLRFLHLLLVEDGFDLEVDSPFDGKFLEYIRDGGDFFVTDVSHGKVGLVALVRLIHHEVAFNLPTEQVCLDGNRGATQQQRKQPDLYGQVVDFDREVVVRFRVGEVVQPHVCCVNTQWQGYAQVSYGQIKVVFLLRVAHGHLLDGVHGEGPDHENDEAGEKEGYVTEILPDRAAGNQSARPSAGPLQPRP